MSPNRKWAPDWETCSKLERDERGAYSAEFKDTSGNTVRVSIPEVELHDKNWGPKPEKLPDIARRTEAILRAILERYVQKHKTPPREIDARDLLNDLWKLRREFAGDC